jgi:hypothetical protein
MKDSHLSYDLGGAPHASVGARKGLGRQFFLISLLLATCLPIILFVSQPQTSNIYSLETLKVVFIFLGTAHAPATLYFYLDRGFSEVIRHQKARYVYLPIALILLTGLIFAFSGPAVQAYVLFVYWGWQAFHYGRQNIGVYAFASIAQTATSPRKLEKLAIDLGTLCGIFGTFKILGMGAAPAYLHPVFNGLYLLGSIMLAGVAIFALFVYVKYFPETTILKTLFYFTSVFFFFPVFISTDLVVAFVSYAMAHGLQYLIFMTTISLNSGERGRASVKTFSYVNVLKLVALILVVNALFSRLGGLKELETIKSSLIFAGAVDFLLGAVLGTTMAHFVVDAGAWKLSLARQRGYITRRFNFLFEERGARQGALAAGQAAKSG